MPLIGITCLTLSCSVRDQPSGKSNILLASDVGVQSLAKTLDNHGDLRTISIGRIELLVDNLAYVHLGQSLVPMPPFEAYQWTQHFTLDFERNYFKSWSRQEFSGFAFEDVHISQQGRAKTFNLSMKNYGPAQPGSSLLNLDVLPQTHLIEALKHPLMVTQGNPTGEGTLLFSGAGRRQTNFFVDSATGLITKIESISSSNAYGPLARIYEFDEYFETNGIKFPGRVNLTLTTFAMEPVVNTYLITKKDAAELPIPSDDVLNNYQNQETSIYPPKGIMELGSGVYLYQNITGVTDGHTYNVLFAEASDFILVAEAPVSVELAEEVISAIKTKIPDKPIRYLVQSHHHNDHLAGIRRYVVEGAKIITTAADTSLINNIAKTTFYHKPDLQDKVGAVPIYEIVNDKKMILNFEGLNLEVHDIGPTLHANEMLVLYFPELNLIFQSDMIIYKEHPHDTPLNKQFVGWMRLSGLAIEAIAGVHGHVLREVDVKKLVDLHSN